MKVSERGQITIPHHLRRRYGLEPFVEVEIVDINGQLILRRITKPLQRSTRWQKARGILKGRVRDIDADIEEMRGR
jgi:AbrB family looped-hinge helix DNA binding protein